MPTARSVAHELLERVFFDGAFSHIVLSNALDDSSLDPRDQGLVTELVYGTLARKRTIDTILDQYVNRALHGLDQPVLVSLRIAAYQLVFLDRIPAHAAVDEAVGLVKRRCGRGAAGFTNGVLRTMLRKKDDWPVWHQFHPGDQPVKHLGLRHSLPDWIAQRLIDDHGFDKAMRIGAAFNERPPFYLRVLDDPPAPIVAELTGVDAVPGVWRTDALDESIHNALEGGRLIIQDLGSQLVSHFSAPAAASRILDACAGLGGKTMHLGYLAGADATIVAVEPNRSKLDRLEQTAQSTSFGDRIHTFHGPIEQLGDDTDHLEKFDLVLVDAPCTGLGVIRRHPETRWRRSPDDVADRAKLQTKLLEHAASYVAEGGTLVYSVCSFVEEEGPAQIEEFLKVQPRFKRQPPPQNTGVDFSQFTDDAGQLRTNPADHDADAFFAARLIHSET